MAGKKEENEKIIATRSNAKELLSQARNSIKSATGSIENASALLEGDVQWKPVRNRLGQIQERLDTISEELQELRISIPIPHAADRS